MEFLSPLCISLPSAPFLQLFIQLDDTSILPPMSISKARLYGLCEKFGPEMGDKMQSIPADGKLTVEYRTLQFFLAFRKCPPTLSSWLQPPAPLMGSLSPSDCSVCSLSSTKILVHILSSGVCLSLSPSKLILDIFQRLSSPKQNSPSRLFTTQNGFLEEGLGGQAKKVRYHSVGTEKLSGMTISVL